MFIITLVLMSYNYFGLKDRNTLMIIFVYSVTVLPVFLVCTIQRCVVSLSSCRSV